MSAFSKTLWLPNVLSTVFGQQCRSIKAKDDKPALATQIILACKYIQSFSFPWKVQYSLGLNEPPLTTTTHCYL